METLLHLTLQDLIAWRPVLQKRRQATARHRMIGQRSGQTHSRRHGRGMSFAESRAYQPGDEVRYIDWKITARTGRPYTKVFEETREQTVVLIIDQTPAQYFASQGQLKAALALHAAAILGWLACDRQDRVGGSILGPEFTRWQPPRSGQNALLHFFHQLLEQHHQLKQPGARQPDRWQRLLEAPPFPSTAAHLFLIGDLLALNTTTLKRLKHLTRHHRITAVHCSDPLEQHLPDAGLLRVRAGDDELAFDSHEPALRDAYAQGAHRRITTLRQTLLEAGIPLIQLMTHRHPLHQLIEQGCVP